MPAFEYHTEIDRPDNEDGGEATTSARETETERARDTEKVYLCVNGFVYGN